MEENTIKPGDVVRLKSGGPWMTVEQITGEDRYANCVWFQCVEEKDPSMAGLNEPARFLHYSDVRRALFPLHALRTCP